MVHPGLHDHGVGAELHRLKHRHGRADAADAGEVAAGRDHPAMPAADDDRLVADRRIVALFDAGIESVAVHVGDGEREELGVAEEPRGTAGRTPRRGGRRIGGKEAITAQDGHDGGV